MPSGMQSKPHECIDEDDVIRVATAFTKQMKTWSAFEAWLVISEDEKEISKEHIKT
jgi:hypothetical protein